MGESWLARVEATFHLNDSDEAWDLAREMAEDAEVGRLLRELQAIVEPTDGGWLASCTSWDEDERFGPTPLAALQALAEAVGK